VCQDSKMQVRKRERVLGLFLKDNLGHKRN